MKVCWFGIYDPLYSRNRILIDGLKSNDVELIECNAQGGPLKYFELIKKIKYYDNDYDILYCAFPVHVSILIAFIFQSKPIFVDAFFSKYDSVVNDRKTLHWLHPKAIFYLALDYLMIKLADHVIVDTNEHMLFWSKWCKKEKVSILPVGIHNKDFFPLCSQKNTSNFIVQFHGTYIPLQGIEKIVHTAKILQSYHDIQFKFIGTGQVFSNIKKLIHRLELDIELIPLLSIEDLNIALNDADVILGIFGDTKKATMVIPNKVYQGMAVCKPVITMDTPAIRELFSDFEIIMTSNNPEDIAKSILDLKLDKAFSARIANNGFLRIENEFNQASLGKSLKKFFLEKIKL